MPRQKTERGPHHESVLSRNMRKLVLAQTEHNSVNAWVKRYTGLTQSTINRICNGTADASVSQLTHICEAIGYAPWQLLHPDFDPRRSSPPLGDPKAMRMATIYASIDDDIMRQRAAAIMEQFAPDAPAPSPRKARQADQ